MEPLPRTPQGAYGTVYSADRRYGLDTAPSHQDKRADYASNADNSAWQQLQADLVNDARKPSTWATMGVGPDPVRAIGSYNSWKHARSAADYVRNMEANRRAWLARTAPTSELIQYNPGSQTGQAARRALDAGRPLEAEQIRAMLQQEHAANTRRDLSAQVNQFFDDPSRAGWQSDVVNRRLNLDLQGISRNYQDDLTQGAQRTASQGLLGGSVDAERRVATEGARDTAAVGAAQRADAAKSDFADRDLQSRQQLLGLVNSDGVGDSGQLSSALQGLADSSRREGENYAIQAQGRQLDAFGRQQQSQAIGQGISGLTTLIQQDPYRASSRNAWLGRPVQSGGW